MAEYGAGSQNWSLAADSNGFVYAGNNNGLLVYNGTHWSLLSNKDQTIVRSVYHAPDGRIYTGSYEEFGYWKDDPDGVFRYHSLTPVPRPASFHNCEIWKIIEHNGMIYFQGFSALFVYDGSSVRQLPLPGTVLFLLKAGNQLFLQEVGGRLFILKGEKMEPVESGRLLEGTEVKTILPYDENRFLIGTTSHGLYMFDGMTVNRWNIPANGMLMEYQINNGLVMGESFIFGTIVKGIVVIDRNGTLLHHLHNENGLQNNTVLSLVRGEVGTVWAGLDKGIDHISFDNLLDIYRESGDKLGAVYTAALRNGVLYVGTNRGIFTYRQLVDEKRFIYEGIVNGSQGQVWEIKEIEGHLYCGHTTGTYLLENMELKRISGVSGGYSMQRLLHNHAEFFIQSTYSPLVIYDIHQGELRYRKEIHGYLEPSRFIESDHLGNVWVGHAVKGLYKLRLSDDLDSVVSLSLFGKAEGLPGDFNIRVFNVGNRVVFTTGERLYTWDDLKNRLIPFDDLNAQLGGFEAATRIVGMDDDRYWFIRNKELALFRIRNNVVTLLCRIYLPLFSVNMVDGYENVVPLNQDLSLICLDEGFAILHPGKLPEAHSGFPKLVFRDIVSMDATGIPERIASEKGMITLSHARNSISISFASLNNRSLSRLYQYMLEGLDTGWSAWTPSGVVEYNRLPKGDYTFRVQTMDETGRLTEPAMLRLTVRPAWYASTVAYLFYGLIIIGLILWSRFLIRRRLIRHHEKLRVRNEIRAQQQRQQAQQEIITLQNEKLQAEISHKNIQLADSTMALIRKNELLIEIKDELEKQRDRLQNPGTARHFERLFAMINRNISNDSDWQIFESLFDQAHENFFKRLKTAYPDLTQSDLKLCAYLKLNLTSKEIAPLLNISFRGVETRRYRLRKRLSLESDENLVSFIVQF